eukprot:CAMPEP_0185723578 /NCGR_PEP_ID=MMETSP1171-20130828/375_1 /TAXON_ID=374046 /ORGANISM="Helicotheca tamensis, Strain CCMP826" /LENGTH=140 /DNA_ID=CAMNT_0028391305 /DNA_START=227 /DNA_END=649 /DNA_ORIENTATION=-
MGRVTRSSTKKAGAAAAPPAKKTTAAKKKPEKKAKSAAVAKDSSDNDATAESSSNKTVTIEAASSEAAFKTRANKIQKAVGKKASVVINAEKPGRGNFVVRVSGRDEPIIELLAMKRPFPALKALDMDEVSSNVIEALGE